LEKDWYGRRLYQDCIIAGMLAMARGLRVEVVIAEFGALLAEGRRW